MVEMEAQEVMEWFGFIHTNMNDKLYELLQEERKRCDEAYAVKLVEKVVFGLVTMFCIAVIAALLKLIII